jgi:hypothetical protein
MKEWCPWLQECTICPVYVLWRHARMHLQHAQHGDHISLTQPRVHIVHVQIHVFDPQECVCGVVLCGFASVFARAQKLPSLDALACKAPQLSNPTPPTRHMLCPLGTHAKHRLCLCVCHFTPGFWPLGVCLWRLSWLISFLKCQFYTQLAPQQIKPPSPCSTQI